MSFQFTVEDGTGVEDANAYLDLSYAHDYHDGRGQLADWNGADVTSTIIGADATANTITIPDHGFVTGDGPARAAGSDLPAGMATLTDYWLVVVDEHTLQLALSYADAIAATPVVVDLTDVGTGSQSLTHADFEGQRQAIVKATDHIEQNFADRFIGVRASAEQGLSWPRESAYDQARGIFLDDQVPEALKRACAEYALLSLQETSLSSSPAVISESKSIDGVSKSVTYAAPTESTATNLAIANRLMRPVILPPMAVRA